MDTRLQSLSQRHTDALNRWVALDRDYKDRLPPVFTVGSNRPSPAFVMTLEYLDEMDALDAERKAAEAHYQEASRDLMNFRAAHRNTKWRGQ